VKILLLGDYSGLSKNLKEGLIELGHEVSLVSTGDGFKETVNSDFPLKNFDNVLLKMLDKIIFPLNRISNYYNYDVVQIIYHNMFGMAQIGYNYYILKKIKEHSGKMFLNSCGEDYFVYKSKDKLRYNPWDESKNSNMGIDKLVNKKWYVTNNLKVANLVDGIIPSLYTYAEAYRNHKKIMPTIPFPMNVNDIKFTPPIIENGKLKVFHGLNREDYKGTKYIREAMERLKRNYPNDVEILIDGKMPLKQYLKILEKTNVVVDQALSYEYGMNAVYSMAMGKVVLSGNEPECQKEFRRSDIPIINIKPSVEDIYNKLEKLVLNKKDVIEIAKKSRLFVEDFHHHVKVAQQYIDAWNSVEVKK